MNENLFATKVYENITTFRLEQNKPNQTQSNPTCSELAYPEFIEGSFACTELGRSVEPVEGVEPISKAKKSPKKPQISPKSG